MSANATFIRALADATQRPVEVSPVPDATTLGAAFLAGMAIGTWAGEDDVAATCRRARSWNRSASRPRPLVRRARSGPGVGARAVGPRLLSPRRAFGYMPLTRPMVFPLGP